MPMRLGAQDEAMIRRYQLDAKARRALRLFRQHELIIHELQRPEMRGAVHRVLSAIQGMGEPVELVEVDEPDVQETDDNQAGAECGHADQGASPIVGDCCGRQALGGSASAPEESTGH